VVASSWLHGATLSLVSGLEIMLVTLLRAWIWKKMNRIFWSFSSNFGRGASLGFYRLRSPAAKCCYKGPISRMKKHVDLTLSESHGALQRPFVDLNAFVVSILKVSRDFGMATDNVSPTCPCHGNPQRWTLLVTTCLKVQGERDQHAIFSSTMLLLHFIALTWTKK